MPQVLRPYQQAAVDAVLDATDPIGGDGYSRVLYTLPTGSGKTTVFAELVRRFMAWKWRVLVIAHRTELIGQAYKRIHDHCDLTDFEIGVEIGDAHAGSMSRVIIGSVQTCYRQNRLPQGWQPDAIICDESHHASATTYRSIAERFGVGERCIYVGCTATAKRTDKQSLYAIGVDGQPVLLSRKGHPPSPADPKESTFEKHVYDYTMLDAIEDGWLVAPLGHTVETDTSLDGVKVTAGDFSERDLAKRVDNARRTLAAIAAWKQVASTRPTVVFCASVEHAHHAAELWRQAGYTAGAVDGETDSIERHNLFERFLKGDLQVLCNMGIATEGTDLPNCSCIVHLRPTKSWNLYMQMSGRSSRVWPGTLDDLQDSTAEMRRLAIAASPKPDSLIIDLCDLYEKCGDLCTVPSMLDLPVKLDLQGHSIVEAKKLLDEFDEVKGRVIGECPTTFEELKVRLHQVNLMRTSGAKTERRWMATDDGYRMNNRPGYVTELVRCGDGFRLMVLHKGEPLLVKDSKPGSHGMRAYLDCAAKHATEAIDGHASSRGRGTLGRLTGKQAMVLRRNGHTDPDIDQMPYARARALIAGYMDAWRVRQGQVA